MHAAGLLTVTGDLLTVKDDVGRHNAVDTPPRHRPDPHRIIRAPP
ncbi:formate dehydrogenase accessory sulfurtransferase FdhD [Rhodococcus sp. WAY2]|nr:hypothetical protein GFS60_03436 [Rhodococcus sp. WAY2]